jgi:Bacteriophage probable baseplate hub protein
MSILSQGIKFLPAYKVEVNGINQTGLVKQRLIDFTVTYSGGGESDSLSFNLDDSSILKRLHAPLDKHDKVQVWMGYKNNLQDMGTFYVNSVTLKGGSNSVDTYSINAKSIDTAGKLFDKKYNVWKNEVQDQKIPLSLIINKIASQHSLKPLLDPLLASKQVEREIQWRESDISFLRFLADKYSAVVKFYDGNLLFMGKSSLSVTGSPIPPQILIASDIVDWSVSFGNRWSFKKFTGEWWDTDEAKLKQESVTNSDAKNEKEYIVKRIFNCADEAKKGAEAEMNNFKAQSNKLDLSIIGNPAVRPFTPIVLAMIRKHVDGIWRTGDVTHSLSSSGYTTNMSGMTEMF